MTFKRAAPLWCCTLFYYLQLVIPVFREKWQASWQSKETGKKRIWIRVLSKWLVEAPKETVRQEYKLVLVNEYGFALDQVAGEVELNDRGTASGRTEFFLWGTNQDKADDSAPFNISEC